MQQRRPNRYNNVGPWILLDKATWGSRFTGHGYLRGCARVHPPGNIADLGPGLTRTWRDAPLVPELQLDTVLLRDLDRSDKELLWYFNRPDKELPLALNSPVEWQRCWALDSPDKRSFGLWTHLDTWPRFSRWTHQGPGQEDVLYITVPELAWTVLSTGFV